MIIECAAKQLPRKQSGEKRGVDSDAQRPGKQQPSFGSGPFSQMRQSAMIACPYSSVPATRRGSVVPSTALAITLASANPVACPGGFARIGAPLTDRRSVSLRAQSSDGAQPVTWDIARRHHLNSIAYLRAISLTCSRVSCFGSPRRAERFKRVVGRLAYHP